MQRRTYAAPEQSTEKFLDAFVDATVRDGSLLDAMVEAAAVRTPSALDAIASEPVARYSRGRKIVVRHEAVRQDADVLSVGGLFGSVEESSEPVVGFHATQIPMGAIQTDRGSGVCICGDRKCPIGPFVIREVR
jgi:hypothetical protein